MVENLTEAAILTVVGMLVVFVALAILMAAIVILMRLWGEKRGEKRALTPAVMETGEGGPTKESIAAMAVSLALAKGKAGRVPARVEDRLAVPPWRSSPWATARREQLMRSRGKVGHQWGRPSR